MARIVQRSEFAGSGCAIQAVGLIVLLLSPTILTYVTLPIGLVLLVAGGAKAVYPTCGACGNRLVDKRVKICPVCREALERRSWLSAIDPAVALLICGGIIAALGVAGSIAAEPGPARGLSLLTGAGGLLVILLGLGLLLLRQR